MAVATVVFLSAFKSYFASQDSAAANDTWPTVLLLTTMRMWLLVTYSLILSLESSLGQNLIYVELKLAAAMSGVGATFGIRFLAALLILLPALCGLVLHALLGIALYSGWRTFGRNTFYMITVQLMCCDVYALLLDLYVAFPLTLTGIQYMGEGAVLYYVPLAFEGIAFNGIFILSLLLTVNRFLLFIFPNVHKAIFTSRGTKMFSLLAWIYVFTLIIATNIGGCRKEFSEEYFYYWYDCSYEPNAYRYKQLVYITSCVISSVMIVMYIILYIKLKFGRQSLKMNSERIIRQEIRYLVQTVLICLLLFFEIAAFVFLPFLDMGGYGQFYLNILLNLIIISSNLVTPIVILSFNSEVREHLVGIYFPSR